MKNPDGPNEDEMDDIPEEMPEEVEADLEDEFAGGVLNLSRERLQSRLERLRRERQEISDRMIAIDPTSEQYKGFMEALEAASKQYRDIEALLASAQPVKAPNRQTGITGITVENFKGISTPVTLPLRRITLLFGANSAGKSTLIHC
jgi:hypothetical protein